jgi:hypothetical protein
LRKVTERSVGNHLIPPSEDEAGPPIRT